LRRLGTSATLVHSTKPGNYRQNGNLHVPANANGIVIDADNVVLNLGGFQLECAGGQNTGIFSDHSTMSYNNITVANENVPGCWTGVDLSGTCNATVEGLTVSGYGVVGIEVNAGAIRKSSVTGGSDPHSIGLGLSSGIVDSNFVAGGDYVGVEVYGSAIALVVGNVVIANYLAIAQLKQRGDHHSPAILSPGRSNDRLCRITGTPTGRRNNRRRGGCRRRAATKFSPLFFCLCEAL
jgi:hypothetical protein